MMSFIKNTKAYLKILKQLLYFWVTLIFKPQKTLMTLLNNICNTTSNQINLLRKT